MDLSLTSRVGVLYYHFHPFFNIYSSFFLKKTYDIHTLSPTILESIYDTNKLLNNSGSLLKIHSTSNFIKLHEIFS